MIFVSWIMQLCVLMTNTCLQSLCLQCMGHEKKRSKTNVKYMVSVKMKMVVIVWLEIAKSYYQYIRTQMKKQKVCYETICRYVFPYLINFPKTINRKIYIVKITTIDTSKESQGKRSGGKIYTCLVINFIFELSNLYIY